MFSPLLQVGEFIVINMLHHPDLTQWSANSPDGDDSRGWFMEYNRPFGQILEVGRLSRYFGETLEIILGRSLLETQPTEVEKRYHPNRDYRGIPVTILHKHNGHESTLSMPLASISVNVCAYRYSHFMCTHSSYSAISLCCDLKCLSVSAQLWSHPPSVCRCSVSKLEACRCLCPP